MNLFEDGPLIFIIIKLDPRAALKKSFFFSGKIEVKITSLIETLQLPNFGRMTTSTI